MDMNGPNMPKLPPGGLILGGPKQVARTTHTTVFSGCEAGIFVKLDADEICQGFRFTIIDPAEGHTYHFDFDQTVFEEWRDDFNQFPSVGEKPEALGG